MNRDEAKAAIRAGIRCTDYLTKSKNNLYCCPLCGSGHGNNGTGAVKYYPDTNTWYCHACKNEQLEGKQGDIIDLIKLDSGTDFNEALNIGAAALGIELDKYNSGMTGNMPLPGAKNEDLQEIFDYYKTEDTQRAADYTEYYSRCQEDLKQSQAAQSYLKARGISIDTATALGIGFDAMADPANCPGAAANDRKMYPAPRIIVPSNSSHYMGRAIDQDNSYPKANAKGATPGIFNAAAIYNNATVFVTEGAFDAMSLIECGAAAIALNSTSNAEKLIQMLKDKPATAAFIICFDNDRDPDTRAKTQARADTLRDGLNRLNYKVIFYNVCGTHKDPNEALTSDREAFKRMIQAAEQELHRDALTDFLDKIQTEAYKPCRTGLNFFDDMLGGGVIQQSLLLLMAAPGTGKTTLAQQIAEAMAAHKKPVIYLNLEMSREQMLAKAISGLVTRKGTALTATEILQGYNWSDADRKAILTAIESYREQILPYMQYNPANVGGDLEQILAYITSEGERARAAGTDAPAIILDYLHLVSSRKGLEIQELIKQTVTGLKEYAKEYNTFVIAIIAANRQSEGRLSLSSARDSSNIEYTGDYMLSLEYFKIDHKEVSATDAAKVAELQAEKYRQMVIRVLKHRFGQPGKSANVYFNAANNLFYGENDFMPADETRTPFERPEPIKQRR